MKRFLLLLTLVSLSIFADAQKGDFDFGRVTYKELEMSKYDPDTSAVAVVLNEFGRARFNEEVDVVFEYHARIKILKKEGLKKGDFQIPLFKDGNTVDREEKWLSLEAVTYNNESNKIVESKFDNKDFFLERYNKNFNVAKFALPNVKVGSIIEVKYTTSSPYYFQFHTWEFQDDIPKIYSEFWAEIPGNFVYSISLRGFNNLKVNTNEIMRDCFHMPGTGSSGYTSGKSDCALGKYVMENIPALREERFMTSKNNFLSAIYFELSEMTGANGVKVKFSEEWSDVDKKLKEHDYFGLKIKKARKFMEDIVTPLVATEPDELAKAKKIYDFFKSHYEWDETVQKYTDADIKKVYDTKKGSSADINLALVGALQSVDLNADPVLISTRDHIVPFKLHPQRSDFNYVVASVRVNNQLYLLDATDDFLPFGVLPMRCLNDQGRIISKEESGWVNLTPTQRQKTVITMNVKLDEAGELKGTMSLQYSGYDAIDQRKKINGKSKEEYVKELTKELNDAAIENYTVENETDLSKPLVEKMDVTLAGGEGSGSSIVYFNPFVMNRYEKNPFQSNERLYPVDLGAPIETGFYINVELPEGMMVDEAPKSIAFSLPNSGGKCLVNVSNTGGKVSLACVIALNKAIYTSEEYHYLKEFFARIVQIQQSSFVFKKK